MRNLAQESAPSHLNKHRLEQHQYSQIKTHYDQKNKIGWLYMANKICPYFTTQLLNEIAHYQHKINLDMAMSDQNKYDYLVIASDKKNIFSLGRDLELIYQLIKHNNRELLTLYAKSCIDSLYQNLTHLSSDLTSISLVQGDALSGGFEAALSTDLIIAERGTKFGFPEVLFNSFPSMGGFSLLSRKIGTVATEDILQSGQLFDAETLFELGVIDILAEKGEGELALYHFIKGDNPAAKKRQVMRKVKEACNPISYHELYSVTDIWVDAILNTSDKDLRMMKRLIMRQSQPLAS